MPIPESGTPHTREVSFATRGDARLMKVLAILVAVSGLVIAAIPLFTSAKWLVVLTAPVGIVLLVIAGGLWVSETDSATNTARLRAEGVAGSAEIRDVDEVDNESISYQITVRVRVEGIVPFDAIHQCSHWKCVDAVKVYQAGRLGTMPVLAMPSTGEWMIVHE